MKKKHKLSLRNKLSIYFILILAVLIVVVLISNLNVTYIFNEYTNMQNLSVQLSNFFDEIKEAKSAYTYFFTSKSDEDIQRYRTAIENAKHIINTLVKSTNDEEVVFQYGLLMNMVTTYDEKVNEMIDLNRSSMSSEAYEKMQEANKVNSLINLQFKHYFTIQINAMHANIVMMEKLVKQFQLWNNLLIFVGVFICSYFILSFTKSITGPIKLLAKSAKKVTEDNFEIEPIYLNTGDEINLLADAFNDMVASIHFYIKEVEQSAQIKEKLLYEENINWKMQHLLKETQLKVLQDKINPHFLFNTLNMLYQTAYIEEANKTMEMLYATSKLLRYGMDKLERSVMIKQELEAIRFYIYIQEQRFGNRIKFTVDDSGIKEHYDFKMPALIIQPIVENAVSHGLSLKKEDGKIIIRCFCDQDNLFIEVTDNGCGMEEEIIQRILFGDYAENDGIGIRNVLERLELFYSRSPEIRINSQLNKGTTILLILPLN